MGKYDSLKFLKRTKARVEHVCSNFGCLINKGGFYYSLELSGRVHSPSFKRKAFCENCYKDHGEKLMVSGQRS